MQLATNRISSQIILSKMSSKIFICILFAVFGLIEADTRLDIILGARNLPNTDIFKGAPDGYAKVYYATSVSDSYVLVGETDNISDNNNPDWPELFNFYVTSSREVLKIEVWDSDVDKDDYIGFLEIPLMDLVSASDNSLQRDLNPLGNGRLQVKTRVNGTISRFESEFLHPKRIVSFPSHLPDIIKGNQQ